MYTYVYIYIYIYIYCWDPAGDDDIQVNDAPLSLKT